ncbi:hypothetical protein FACS1894163_08100 [Spirochaetia bacterium]|nr:hypothetical protein FACS1894163_08100 [Spirochaetia bacterium]
MIKQPTYEIEGCVKPVTNLRLFVDEFAKFFLTITNKILSKIMFVICVKMRDPLWKREKFIYGYDYIRFSTLELVSHEIYENNIQGCVAELGVYRGDFACCINKAFPDRNLYLFDTFEGFDQKDLMGDTKSNFSKNSEKVFTNTNVNIVLKKMKHKNKCIIKQGWFPETTKDVEEKFAFVSIDCDLYEPIYNGLKYFFPHLSEGGYIFVHEYTSAIYKGSREAVKRFLSEEHNAHLFPLTDQGGTGIIKKS